MNYFLMSSSKVRQRFERSEDQHPAFRDQVILNALPDLYRSLFHKQDFKDLSDGQRIETLRQIRFRFCANINQIARVTGLPCEEAAGRYRHFGDFSRKICIFVS
ncbi:MAG: hypothetical protein K5910_08270 [Bacteroidales bacterium]|nr:hypothetical protein [Bacteroidales bacterium]